jgi:hypothetical protein
MSNGWSFICMFYLLSAQQISPEVINAEHAAEYMGKIVKINATSYQTRDDGQTLTLLINTKQRLTLVLNDESRKKIKKDTKARRELNTQIKSPLDTSITATGRIILRGGHLIMQVSRASDVYLGADLKIEKP